MHSLAFYLFSAIAVAGAVCLVTFRSPVTSATSMVVSFLGLAALFVGLNAFFVGVIQVLVYAGAIMVLFIFIIMLLDLNSEERSKTCPALLVASFLIPALFMCQLLGVLQSTENESPKALPLTTAAAHFELDGKETKISQSLKGGDLPDVHLLGEKLFTRYNFPLQVVGVLLLVATIGVVSLSKKGSDRTAKPADQ